MKHKVGYHFHPNNDELIDLYLRKKALGLDSQEVDEAIAEVDVLDHHPDQLPQFSALKLKDPYWYFFYQLDYSKYRKSTRVNRTLKAGTGYWKATGKVRKLWSEKTRQHIGTKKTLVFCPGRVSDKTEAEAKPKSKSQSESPWVIHEYHPNPDFHNPKKYVIIKLVKKAGKAVTFLEHKISYSTEKAEGKATSPILDDVESNHLLSSDFDNHATENTVVEQMSMSSFMVDTPSPANLEQSCGSSELHHYVQPEHGPSWQEFLLSSGSGSDCNWVQNPVQPEQRPSSQELPLPNGSGIDCNWVQNPSPQNDLESINFCAEPDYDSLSELLSPSYNQWGISYQDLLRSNAFNCDEDWRQAQFEHSKEGLEFLGFCEDMCVGMSFPHSLNLLKRESYNEENGMNMRPILNGQNWQCSQEFSFISSFLRIQDKPQIPYS